MHVNEEKYLYSPSIASTLKTAIEMIAITIADNTERPELMVFMYQNLLEVNSHDNY